jgi:tRNA 2-thiocytidine biosynthesis protein TtcA
VEDGDLAFDEEPLVAPPAPAADADTGADEVNVRPRATVIPIAATT